MITKVFPALHDFLIPTVKVKIHDDFLLLLLLFCYDLYIYFLPYYFYSFLIAVFNIVIPSVVAANGPRPKEVMLGTVKIPLTDLIHKRTGT